METTLMRPYIRQLICLVYALMGACHAAPHAPVESKIVALLYAVVATAYLIQEFGGRGDFTH
jgi:hypothetical protein